MLFLVIFMIFLLIICLKKINKNPRGWSGIPLVCPTNSQTPEDSSSAVTNDNKKLTFKKLEPAYVLDFCRKITEMVKQSPNEMWIKLL